MALEWVGRARRQSPGNLDIALLHRQIQSECALQSKARAVRERLDSDRAKFGKPGRGRGGETWWVTTSESEPA